ncbi:MAG: SsrA-binding protein SmpB [Christensenellaceae bacterium]|nr:SsrA-binding protein SmpB [Christensenellaceae bacterium]
MSDGVKVLIKNKKAYHDYFIDETLEAGIALAGSEVKSIRAGKANIRDAYVRIVDNEAFVVGMHVSPYEKGSFFNQDPLRKRKLLLHKREIAKLYSLVTQRGLTLVPLKVYLKQGKVKLEIGVARGKKLYDKRRSIAERDAQRAREIATKVAR